MKIKSLIVLAVIGTVFTSCNKQNKIEAPESAEITWYYQKDYEANMLDLSKVTTPTEVEMKDAICFVAKSGDADSYVVFTGQTGSEFDKRNLSEELINDTKNHVAEKAVGVALSTKDGLGRMTAQSYRFSDISPAEKPFQMYAVARNYNYNIGEFEEIVAGPYNISVVDTQVDLWDVENIEKPFGSQKYSFSATIKSFISGETTGEKGSLVKIEEDPEKGVKPGVKIIYPVGGNPAKAKIKLKVNNARPIVAEGELSEPDKKGVYTWTIDLTTPKTITIASKSAAADAKSGDKYTKDYIISAEEYK